MSLRKRLGLPEQTKRDEVPKINMSNVQVPLDLMLEIIVRQQNQLFEAMAGITGRMIAGEEMHAANMEQMDHLHADVIELQQFIHAASQHPADKVEINEEGEPSTEEAKAKSKRNLIN
jgi:hypothetical protein